MGTLVLFLAVVAALIGLPILAARGAAYRGVYFAVALVALIAGIFFVQVGYGPVPPGASEDAQRGLQFAHEYFPLLAMVAFSATLGGLLGGLLYRPAKRQV